jgi:hypothetical protein
MISPRMQRREIQKAVKAMEDRNSHSLEEPMTEPIAAKFGAPYCTKRSVIYTKKSPCLSFVVDIRSRNGATVAKDVKVNWKKTGIF